MNELIAVAERIIGEASIQTTNARDLHAFLENGDHFATWIADRIKQYDFAEGVDFVTYSGFSEKGRPPKEYAISLDMAKELAMVERNEKGKQARRYFIDCERRANAPADPATLLDDAAAMRGILLNYTEKVIALQGEVEEMRPQVQALERIAISDGSLCITDAAKNLQVQPKALFNYLREHRWIYRRPNSASDIAYQDKLQSGVLEHKVTVVTRADGSEKTTTQVRVTPKGLARLGKLFPPVAHAA